MGKRTRKRLGVGWAVLLVVSLVGLFGDMFSDVFLHDPFDAYGEVPIPGSRTLHLPAGDVKVSFHTQTVGTLDGGDLPIPPDLEVSFDPPSGVAAPQFSRNVGDTGAVNQDAHIRLGAAHIASAGDYTVKTNGKTDAFLSPHVSFGREHLKLDFLPWVSAGLFVVSLVGLMASRSRQPRPTVTSKPKTTLRQLETIAALRDSGGLTDEEYEAEKRRLLDDL
jgi:hypothetical protein